MNDSERLIQNLLGELHSEVGEASLLETHISWILLSGDLAYKIKKPVKFGFLDFSSLAQRKFYCEEELRLNSRLAPDLYLGVVPITGTPDKPKVNGHGVILEYAICMRQFPQRAQLDNHLQQGLLSASEMESIGDMLAVFHRGLSPANEGVSYGSLTSIQQPVEDNFVVLSSYFSPQTTESAVLANIQGWVAAQNTELTATFLSRKQLGFIRECHGDLHLRNLIWLKDHPIAFDCLEFDEGLRWIDVMSEVAFLVMDLLSRKQSLLAFSFLNQYLQKTGDYKGLIVLPYYLCYRALVRAKVDALRHQQEGINADELAQTDAELHDYLSLATSFTHSSNPKLIITRGLSASGKSTISKPLACELGAIRIRSDVERKRLHELDATASARSSPNTGLYTTKSSDATYAHLLALADTVLAAGYTVIIDAVFLELHQRQLFQTLAEKQGYQFIILEFTAKANTLRQRIKKRTKGVSDAGAEVLEYQLKHWQPLEEAEAPYQCWVNTEENVDVKRLAKFLNKKSS